jgi:hypothetical protein
VSQPQEPKLPNPAKPLSREIPLVPAGSWMIHPASTVCPRLTQTTELMVQIPMERTTPLSAVAQRDGHGFFMRRFVFLALSLGLSLRHRELHRPTTDDDRADDGYRTGHATSLWSLSYLDILSDDCRTTIPLNLDISMNHLERSRDDAAHSSSLIDYGS